MPAVLSINTIHHVISTLQYSTTYDQLYESSWDEQRENDAIKWNTKVKTEASKLRVL